MAQPDPAITVPSRQFFDIGSFDESSFNSYDTISNLPNRNPQFTWPKKYFRQTDGSVVELQRGYIRLLTPNGTLPSTSAGVPRCFFQFNPDSVTRGLVARDNVHLWINQEPGQLGQPAYGEQNFSFELLFNREAEVFSELRQPESFLGTNAPENVFESVGVRDMAPRDVGHVGVLADLAMLDAIIGVGLSVDTYQEQINQYNARQDYAARRSTVDSSGNSSETTNSPNVRIETPDAFRSINIGNKSFIMPNPVRIIFSRLFMIDGYIQKIEVSFNKFSPSMVPTQCIVGLQIQAMYFGLAQKNTFLTQRLSGIDTGGSVISGGGGTGETFADADIRDLQELSNNLMFVVEHQNGGNEKIFDFGVAEPQAGGNKITFRAVLSDSFLDWVKRTQIQPTVEPWLFYRVKDGDTVLFESGVGDTSYAAAIDPNVEIKAVRVLDTSQRQPSNNPSRLEGTLTMDFFPNRPSTFNDGTTILRDDGNFTYEVAIHVDLRVGDNFIQGNQKARFIKTNLDRDTGFGFGSTIAPTYTP